MEPLEALVQRITGRRRQKPQYSPVEFEEVGGSMRGLPAGIAAADDMQSYDLGSAVPPTQPIFARGDEDSGPETPVQLASGGQGESNPFRFASQNAQPQIRQTSGPVQYRRECGANGCRMVPVGGDEISYGGGQLFNSMPAMQSAPSQALPPGVTLGPGETFVEGSLREVPKPFQATPSTPQPMAAQPAPATTQPTAQQSKPPQSPLEIYQRLSEEVRRQAGQYESDAKAYYADADSALAQRNAIGFMQYDERGDRATQAGINARSHYALIQSLAAGQMNLDRELDARKERDRRNTLEARLEDEAKVVAARGMSIPVRVQQLMEIRNGVAAAQGVAVDEQYGMKLRDMIEGEIYASDSSGYYLDYYGSLSRWRASGMQDDAARQDAITNRSEAFGLMLRRYGDAENREDLERRMRGELTPIIRERFVDYFKDNPEMAPQGVTGSRLGEYVNAEALRAVNTSIARVAQYLESGRSPYEDAAFEPQPASDSPRAFPQRSISPRFDSQMVE